ncbi:MAG: rRNA adenine N-6-methyltransferase family protein [Patescibacteria group bacterium]|nr:rRNA adenine N-6-methyltransferase family protein [Patescibacteria group bacterium]
MKKIEFLKEYIRKPKTLGAVTPSSPQLVKKMIKALDFEKIGDIIEFGPGTGNTTKSLLSKMCHNQKLIVFEIHPAFAKNLEKIKDKRLVVIQDSAENFEHYIKKHKPNKPLCIFSSLPLGYWKKPTLNKFFTAISEEISKDGIYIQFAYSLNRHVELMPFFKNIEVKFVLMNMPPAFIYVCSNK